MGVSRRAIIVAAIVLLIGIVAAAGITLTNKSSDASASIKQVVGQNTQTGTTVTQGPTATDNLIATYQENARTKNDADSYANLGLAYLQKAREVGDPVYYTKAEDVLKKSLSINPNDVIGIEGMGSLALSRHQFAQALDWGNKGKALQPATAYNYDVINDALIELGRYDEAVDAAQQMVDLRPDLSSYSRVSYQRELHGMYQGAVDMMHEAIIAGGPNTENVAYVTYQLGMLYFSHNDLANAETQFQAALVASPGYVYAEEGMAKIKAAHGDYSGAMALYTDITQRYPLEQFIIEMGDLYGLMGKPTQAAQQYDLVRGIDRIYQQNGVDTDVESALFNADHDYNLADTLATAKKGYADRLSIKGADVLAWTLYKTGDYKAAADMSKQALRLGYQDSLYFFHAGMIADKLGDTANARSYLDKALTLNPNFSFLYADTARKTLNALGGATSTK